MARRTYSKQFGRGYYNSDKKTTKNRDNYRSDHYLLISRKLMIQQEETN